MNQHLRLKILAWLLLLPFLVLLLVVLVVGSLKRAVEYPLLLVSLQILKAYPRYKPD